MLCYILWDREKSQNVDVVYTNYVVVFTNYVIVSTNTDVVYTLPVTSPGKKSYHSDISNVSSATLSRSFHYMC